MQCVVCGKRAYSEYCVQHKPRKPIVTKKRPKQRGKRTLEYEVWRDTIAIPYLDKTYGHICAKCGQGDYGLHILEVDHIQNRGSHPELKMVLTNVQWLGRIPCHSDKTDHR